MKTPWGQGLRNEIERVATQYSLPLLIATLAVIGRLMFSNQVTFVKIVRGLIIGLLMGALTAMYLADFEGLSEGERGMIVGAVAVLSEDLFIMLVEFGHRLRQDPSSTLKSIYNIWRGKR